MSISDAEGAVPLDKRAQSLLTAQYSPNARGLMSTMEAAAASPRYWRLHTEAAELKDQPANKRLLHGWMGPALARAPASSCFVNVKTSKAQALALLSKEGNVEFIDGVY